MRGVMIVVGLSWIVAAACVPETGQTGDARFDQVGYFKDDLNNRIFTVLFPPEATRDDVQAHAERLMHTSGRLMAAYFYPVSVAAPGDEVTLAPSAFEANEAIFGLNTHTYAFMRYLNGNIEFVECGVERAHDLCKQE